MNKYCGGVFVHARVLFQKLLSRFEFNVVNIDSYVEVFDVVYQSKINSTQNLKWSYKFSQKWLIVKKYTPHIALQLL
jgi:hypothetical protein